MISDRLFFADSSQRIFCLICQCVSPVEVPYLLWKNVRSPFRKAQQHSDRTSRIPKSDTYGKLR
ncbi:hypothetical protein [Nostoc commune]|uniref:hypothetical protein n=1 Tax=Nostoc commune TaxID=1178 RepID=UPI0018C49F25|nr:hypothetical protein [Nostoc commune]MBG1264660.1 hypothetical protein [Nostoc commune BAE]